MRPWRHIARGIVLGCLLLGVGSLASLVARAATPERTILLATTTSTQDTGLLDTLIPAFEKQTGYIVKTVSVGSGQAMALGRKGEADVLLVHSPDAEKQFVADSLGINRRLVMHNDFVIVGPAEDPAGIAGMTAVVDALKKISGASALFISRADESGTHAMEKKLWKAAAIDPVGRKWYQETGLGMGQTLNVAAEKKAYTLSDRGTYLALRHALGLTVLCENDPLLLNTYHVIEVNGRKWPKVNAAGARAFADYLVSAAGQTLIATFGAKEFGSALFVPDAGKKETP
jgi:tungstate transport system substrate-binding protein